jgi:hypothetical protein
MSVGQATDASGRGLAHIQPRDDADQTIDVLAHDLAAQPHLIKENCSINPG